MLMDALRPLLAGRSPATMDEDAYADISFAARETAQDADRIADLVGASDSLKGPFRGLRRSRYTGSPASWDCVTPRRSPRASVADLSGRPRHSHAGIMPTVAAGAASLAAEIRRAAARATLRPSAADGIGLSDVFARDLPDPHDQAALVEAFADHDGSPEAFWHDFAKAHPGKPVGAIQLSLQLASAFGNNKTLTDAVRAAHPRPCRFARWR